MTPTRAAYLVACLENLGLPYLWGAKGEEMIVRLPDRGVWVRVPTPADGSTGRPVRAVDCSGEVTEPLHRLGGPDLRFSHHTDKLWEQCPPVAVPKPGDFALYGGSRVDDVEHVEVVVSVIGPHAIVVGSSGGGSRTTTIAKALEDGACVKLKRSHLYRKDFRGFRRNIYLADS